MTSQLDEKQLKQTFAVDNVVKEKSLFYLLIRPRANATALLTLSRANLAD